MYDILKIYDGIGRPKKIDLPFQIPLNKFNNFIYN